MTFPPFPAFAPENLEVTQQSKDVVIVGAGPTGSTLALALATYGVNAHVVTSANWLSDSPRAHITNQRTMEVFRDLGIEREILQEATDWDQMGDTPFTTSLVGEELVRLRTWGTGDRHHGAYRRASPCRLVDLIQPKLEPILVKIAAERGASFAFNTDYHTHVQDAEGVTIQLQDRITGQDYELRARYLFGADGARSRIVEQLGLPIEGHMARAGTVYTQFQADLGDVMQHRPSILNWIVSPEASFGEIGMGLLRAVQPWTHWIAGWGFDLAKGPDLDPNLIRMRIGALIGAPEIAVKIDRTSVWYVNQAYATRYQDGRVLCGGDAVHRHPPSSGLGMNTCVQDAFNLAWKLAMVLKGQAGPELLESYSAERAPVGKQIVLRANQSRLDYAPLNACFRVQVRQIRWRRESHDFAIPDRTGSPRAGRSIMHWRSRTANSMHSASNSISNISLLPCWTTPMKCSIRSQAIRNVISESRPDRVPRSRMSGS